MFNKLKKNKLIFITSLILLVGCGSTPYRDDFTKHVNLTSYNESNFQFTFVGNQNVDLRGVYQQNDQVGNSAILYQGGAGLIGLFAQVAVHTSMVNSQRNGKLSKQQEEANKPIADLIGLAEKVPLTNLVGLFQEYVVEEEEISFNTLRIQPIFFSNKEMSEFSIKLILWLPKDGKNSRKRRQFKYRNMVQVYSDKMREEQSQRLVEGDKKLLTGIFTSLLKKALFITKNEITGRYSDINSAQQTFIMSQSGKRTVIRGALVTEKCGLNVIKDVHSWLIAYPNDKLIENQLSSKEEQCALL